MAIDYSSLLNQTKAAYVGITTTGGTFSKRILTQQTNNSSQIEALSPEKEMEVFKQEFYDDIAKIKNHKTVKNMAVNISDKAFEKMKEDPSYREKILSLIARDVGDSYAPRNNSVLITVGESASDYRADSWPICNDSEFDMQSQNSFYKKTSNDKKQAEKERLEEYRSKKLKEQRWEHKKLLEKLIKDSEIHESIRKESAEKAYKAQILYDN